MHLFIRLFVHSFTHSPTHSLTLARTHPFTHSLTHSPCTHPLTHSLLHARTHSLTHYLTLAHTHSLTHSINHSFNSIQFNSEITEYYINLEMMEEKKGFMFSRLQINSNHNLTSNVLSFPPMSAKVLVDRWGSITVNNIHKYFI